MDDVTRQAIIDLLALAKTADNKDAERIQEIIRKLQTYDAHDDYAMRLYRNLSR
jgi:PHP family Zn ribbon phosphoesterase